MIFIQFIAKSSRVRKDYTFAVVLEGISRRSMVANHPLKIMKAQPKWFLAGGATLFCLLEGLGHPGCLDLPAGIGGIN